VAANAPVSFWRTETILKEETMADSPAILLVHGAWHSSACWDKVRAVLAARGREVHSVDLPTVHAAGKASLGLYDDARTVRAAIEAIDGPVVVVGHSYGGVPVTQGAAGLPRVVHIVYIAAFVLDLGESLLSGVGGVPPSWWNIHGDLATAGVPGQSPEWLFYDDLPDDEARAATAQLEAQAVRAFRDPVTEVAWRTVPTTYLVTERDHVFPVEAQQGLAARAGSRMLRTGTSHSPFLSRPEATADVIDAVGGQADTHQS
jgi:pimeloyl-ACP methyl ester carboxylesterase